MPHDRLEFPEGHVHRPATIDEWLAEVAADAAGRSVGVSPSVTLREIRDELDRS